MMPNRGWKAPAELYGSIRGSLKDYRFGHATGAEELGAEVELRMVPTQKIRVVATMDNV